jgi:hypothetical protein
MPNGEVDHKIKYESNNIKGYFKTTGGKNNWKLDLKIMVGKY